MSPGADVARRALIAPRVSVRGARSASARDPEGAGALSPGFPYSASWLPGKGGGGEGGGGGGAAGNKKSLQLQSILETFNCAKTLDMNSFSFPLI